MNFREKNTLGWKSFFTIKDKAVEKIALFKNPSYTALLLVEFFLTTILVGAIMLYLDGSLMPPVFPYNILIFGLIAYGVIHFYNYTAFFRKTRVSTIRRNSSLKSAALEFMLLMLVAIAALVYQNPKINLLPYPYNLVLFLALLAIPLYFYIDEKFLRMQMPLL